MKTDYYKAYDVRYKQVHDKGLLWENEGNTIEVLEIIKKYKMNKNSRILDLGCGEGRDAIYLLNNGYNVLAIDYSENVIEKCKEITNNKYNSHFMQLDLIEDTLDEKFDFIYSIAVLHMFVLKEHRDKFWRFIKHHLKEKVGACAFVVSMGSGKETYSSNIDNAFKSGKRIHQSTNKELEIAETSCCIKTIDELKKEIKENNLECVNMWVSDKIPGFNKCICMIVR